MGRLFAFLVRGLTLGAVHKADISSPMVGMVLRQLSYASKVERVDIISPCSVLAVFYNDNFAIGLLLCEGRRR